VKQENSSLFMNSILNRKMRVENRTKIWVWQDSSLCPETSTKNAVQEFHLVPYLVCYAFKECKVVLRPYLVHKGFKIGRNRRHLVYFCVPHPDLVVGLGVRWLSTSTRCSAYTRSTAPSLTISSGSTTSPANRFVSFKYLKKKKQASFRNLVRAARAR
jgi:hypothetical protein